MKESRNLLEMVVGTLPYLTCVCIINNRKVAFGIWNLDLMKADRPWGVGEWNVMASYLVRVYLEQEARFYPVGPNSSTPRLRLEL